MQPHAVCIQALPNRCQPRCYPGTASWWIKSFDMVGVGGWRWRVSKLKIGAMYPLLSIRIYNVLKNLDGDDDDVITQEEFRTSSASFGLGFAAPGSRLQSNPAVQRGSSLLLPQVFGACTTAEPPSHLGRMIMDTSLGFSKTEQVELPCG